MMVKAYRTEEHARESYKDLILDDHTQCGCECGEESGRTIWRDMERESYNSNFKPQVPEEIRGNLPPE